RGAFREDLFFRIHVVRVDLPPLRERREDVPLLVEHFLARLAGPGPSVRMRPEARRRLALHAWPGNVRELESAVRRAAVLAAAGPIEAEHLPRELGAGGGAAGAGGGLAGLFADRRRAGLRAAREVERSFLERARAEAGGNVTS